MISRSRHFLLPFTFFLLPFSFAAPGGVVKTIDGKTYEGEIRLESSDALSVMPKGGAAAKLALDDVLLADFRAAETGPDRWVSRDVGPVTIPGVMRVQGTTVSVKGSGAAMAGDKDEFHYACQVLKGDGQIVARVASVGQTDRLARAGLMLRATFDQTSTYAAVAAQAGGGAVFAQRNRMGGAPRAGSFNAGVPTWLKLVRRGDNYTGFFSADGEIWEQIASESFPMPQQIFVGLFVCAFKRDAASTAVFERVAAGPLKEEAGPQFKGLVLRDGTRLACQIRSANDSVVRIWREREQDLSVPVSEVSRIILNPPPKNHLARLNQAGRTGALLNTGDFFEGTLTGIQDNRIRISSVLFGLRSFENWQIAGIVLRDAAPAASKYEIRLTGASQFGVDQIEWGKELVTVNVPAIGKVRFPQWEFAEIRAGASRFCPLQQIKPHNVRSLVPGGFAVNATTVGLPLVLAGQPAEHGLGLAAGTSVSYQLDGAYRLAMAKLGVPEGVLPTAAVRFVVLGDDRELYRSPVMTSLSDPATLALTVSGVKTLTFRVDPAPGSLGGAGLVADPALVK
ncbi:MAG: NPCBM/NEW2 domain-containing protein [Tepidisphaerales bacterium]